MKEVFPSNSKLPAAQLQVLSVYGNKNNNKKRM